MNNSKSTFDVESNYM